MTAKLRKTGIDIVGDVPWGTHFCHFYQTEEDQLDILIPYFKMGLENNEFCMWIVCTPTIVEEATAALRLAISDFDRHLAAGDIEVVQHTQWYLEGGAFDLRRVINGLQEKLEKALSRGYDGIRVNGHEAWLTEKDWNDFSEYEKKLNELIVDRRMIVLCTYSLSVSTAAKLLDVAHSHQFAIARRQGNWEVLETPELKQAKAEIRTLVEELERRVAERTRELAAANEELRREIIERKRAEEERSRLVTAIEQAAEAVLVTDPEGTIVYANPSFELITGYSRKEVVGSNPRILKSGRHEDKFYKQMWETITSGTVWRGRMTNRKKDGSLFEEEGSISPIKDDSGRIVSYVAVKRDVTREVSLQAQLVQAQKMEAIATLAGGIAHDFNNLLQVTSGYSELMLQEKEPEDKDYADLQKIYHAAKSGAELVQRLLTFSRKVEFKPIPLNLNRQIVQVEKLLRRTIPKMIDIGMDLSDDLAEVNADPTQVEQILMNLAVNARDAMPDKGRLMIVTKNATLDEEYCKAHVGAKSGEYVMLSVSDTGHGMTKETIEHIFEPFYTTKEFGRGTGLGLAMVYGIVKQHDGFISCYSEVGHGTTFTIYFPSIESQPEPDLEDSGIMPAFGDETILLVDDEELIRDLGSRILSKAGYRVLTATNGKHALDLFERERGHISLVILDFVMPDMGGKECLTELRKIDPQLKVLITSGHPADPSMAEAAQGFVNKPFRMKELLQQARRILDER